MTLAEAVDSYVSLRRSLGAVFSADTRILRALVRTLGDVPLHALDRRSVHAFCRGSGAPTRWWERKHQTLRGFFAYLVTRGHLDASPLHEPPPRVPRSFEPYVYSRDELQRILDATAILESPRSPLRPATFRALLLTLYAAGLRPGEGLRLRCCDVDLAESVLAIWDTKFFKSRLVPIGVGLAAALSTYSDARKALPAPVGGSSAFFASRDGAAIALGTLEKAFARLREHAGVRRPPGSRWQPRLHDLRHAFAGHRLIAWYREGADLQSRLPLLATYLGHVDVRGTQAYLTMTPELLAEASRRFDTYAAVGHGERRHA